MTTGKDEKSVGVATAGQAEARAFVAAEIPAEPVRPTVEMDRVQVIDPRHSPTLTPSMQRKVSGPRVPEQMTRGEVKARASVPMERPATKMQVVKLDPEMLLELSRRKAARERGELGPAPVFDPDLVRTETSETSEADRVTLPIAPKTTAATASPWTAQAVEIDRSALPSALAPSVRSVPVPASVTPVSAASSSATRRPPALVFLVVLLLGTVAGFAVMEMMPKTPAGVGRSESSAMAVASVAPVASVPVAPVASTAAAVPVPAASTEVDAGARLVPEAADGGPSALVKVKGGAKNNDDPYEAATSTAVKAAEPVVAPPPPVPVTPVAPIVTTPDASPPHPSALPFVEGKPEF
jgi:hypothetical protein